MPVEAVLFDLDDTLVVQEGSDRAALLATAGEATTEAATARRLADAVRRHARHLWDGAPTGPYCRTVGISAEEGLWGRFLGEAPALAALRDWVPSYRRESWGAALAELGLPNADAGALGERFVRERSRLHVLFPESVAVLDGLRGRYTLGLVTNGAPCLQRDKLRGAGLERAFGRARNLRRRWARQAGPAHLRPHLGAARRPRIARGDGRQ